jgi:hypothetical protein
MGIGISSRTRSETLQVEGALEENLRALGKNVFLG